jgi:uncharacterized Zn-finger protein
VPKKPKLEETPTTPPAIKTKKKHMCTFKGCSKGFTQSGHRNAHERTHTVEKDHKCPFYGCGKVFALRDTRDAHKILHLGEKPYECSFHGCSKAFARRDTRDAHEILHLGEKPYECSIQGCDKTYADRSSRDRHQRAHSGVKKYECSAEGCGLEFAYLINRDDHLKRHHWDRESTEYIEWNAKQNAAYRLKHPSGEKPFQCSVGSCGKFFAHESNRHVHIKRHHWDRESPEYKEWNDKINAAFRLRYRSDSEFRAARLCRCRLHYMLKSQTCKKKGHTHELLGCAWAELVAFLEDNIFGYKVGDKGIHIDHIRPVSSFRLADNPIEQRKCMNFNNLQLMPAKENHHKSDYYDASAYAQTPSGKAVALLSVGWGKQFAKGAADDVDFDSDSDWDEELDEDVEYEMRMEF